MAELLRPAPPSKEELEAFLTKHQQLLQLEHDEEEEQTRLLNSNCSPKLLEQRGLALGSLGVASVSVGLGGKTLVELCRPLAYHVDTTLPAHTFRNGDPVRIEEHTSGTKGKGKVAKKEEESGVDGVVYRISKEKIIVAIREGKDVELPERLRLLKLANSVTFDRMRRTLEHISRLVLPESTSTPADNWPLVNSLLGMAQPSWSDEILPPMGSEESDTKIKWFSTALNDSQKEAIDFCLRAEQVACIHGPPGKTHTLIELILQLLSRPAGPHTTLPPRILVTTPSNLALDNILLRLHALSQEPEYAPLLKPGTLLRLGHPTRVHRHLLGETLDYRAAHGDDGELVRAVAGEIEGHLANLGKKRGERGAVKGRERGKKWEEVRELRKEYRQREAKVVTNVVKTAQVVLATCHSAGSRQLNNMSFDVAIIDEATQAVEAVCWVPILKSKKLILAGDPQQLPPTILSKDDEKAKETKVTSAPASNVAEDVEKLMVSSPRLRPPRTLETTLFDRLERLYGPGIKRVLNVQYRMNQTIADFPSKTLYDDALISDVSVATHTLLDLPTIVDAESEDAKEALEPPVVFFDTAGCEFYERAEADEGKSLRASLGEGSKSNENEAVVVAKWARKLVSLGVPAAEVGIVVPYQAQVSLLSSVLHEEFPDMTIGTVDGLQGQERDAIILSLVRSNPTGDVGFLGEYRRLNVAMTRPRRQLCVVGDSDTVAKGSSYLKKWMQWLDEHADVRYAGDEV